MRQSGQTNADFERNIGNEIENLQRKLGEAASAVGEGDKNNRMANNLDRARNLVRGVDSMQQQMRDGQRGQQGQAEGSKVSKDNRANRANRDSKANRVKQGQQGQQGTGPTRSAGPTGPAGSAGQQGQQGQQGQGGPERQSAAATTAAMVRSAVRRPTATTGADGASACTRPARFGRSATRRATGPAKPSVSAINCAMTA